MARCGWDESDAYLRKQRDHVQPLCSRLSPAWNYGEWAAGFYSQLCIRVVSADGLTPGYTPEEGYSQGNPFSANGYQGASVLASSSPPFPKHIRIPPWPSPTALPINRGCYSDDRAFFEPTIAQVSIIAGECVRATLHTNGVPNMDKLEFSYHALDAEGLPQPAIVEVPRFKTRTLPAPPLIVGIPIFHTLKPADKLSDLLCKFRSVYHSTCDKPMSPLLMVRSFVAFALSRWDFVFSGVLAPPSWHHDLQVYAHKAYRAAFALPPWSCSAFLHLPLHAGGVGCPSLPLRNLGLLAMTYLHASVSRNPLSRASAVYLLDTLAPFSEGMALRTALATLRTRVHTHPFPHLHGMRVHAHVASGHPLPNVLWVVTDGALAGHRVGGGIVFYNPQRGVLRSYSFGVSVVAATSADAEWLAKLVARSLLKGWDGQASFLADATASMHCGFTKAPPPYLHPQPPLQTVGLRHGGGPRVLGTSTTRHRSHTHGGAAPTRSSPTSSTRRLPSTALHCPTPPSMTRGRASHQRRAAPPQSSTQCSSPTRPDPHQRGDALSSLGHCCLERCGVLGPPPELHPPQGAPSARLALAGATVSPPPPTSVHYYTCDYCDAHVDHPWSHVACSCPTFLVRSQWAFVRLLATVPKLAGSYLPDGTNVVQPASNNSITVKLETDLHTPSPLPPHRWTVFSPFGLVRSAHPSSAAEDGTSDRVRVVLEAMVDGSPSLTDLLMVLDTLEWPTRPSSTLNPHVSELCAHVLPLSVVFLARWNTCHLQHWRMQAGGRLPMRMPPPPPTARWAPTLTFLVHPNLQDPSIAHLVQVHLGPLVILTIATALQPLRLMLPEPMNTLAIRHHVLLWDAAVVRTLTTQERFH